MSKSSTANPAKPLSAKSAWSKGPPQTAPSPRSQSPAPSAQSQPHLTHSRRPSALGQAVPIKDGVSIPRNNIGAAAAKQGSSVTFGSIDDASAPISSSPAAPNPIKESVVKSFGTVPATPATTSTHINGKPSISSSRPASSSVATTPSPGLTASTSTSATPSTTTASKLMKPDIKKLFQSPLVPAGYMPYSPATGWGYVQGMPPQPAHPYAQHMPQPPHSHIPQHPNMAMSLRNPPHNLPGTPAMSHATPNPIHQPHPPPPLPHPQNNLSNVASPPPTPVSSGPRLNASSSAFVPRPTSKIVLKDPAGNKVNIESLAKTASGPLPPTRPSSGQGSPFRGSSPGTPRRASIRMESEEKRKKRVAEKEEKEKEKQRQQEAAEKAKKEKEEEARRLEEEEKFSNQFSPE